MNWNEFLSLFQGITAMLLLTGTVVLGCGLICLGVLAYFRAIGWWYS